jgi:hypothetical protein
MMRKSDYFCLEGTCRVSTMIIEWKRDRKTIQMIEIITINSSENDKPDHKFTIVPPRKEV